VATVVMLVVLRLSLGWHFLYEGVWKITNRKFTAEPFLSEAKGPLAPLFRAMLDDVDGTKRLTFEADENGRPRLGPDDKPVVKAESTLAAWKALKDHAADKYGMREEQKAEADKLYARYETWLNEYLDENAEEIVAYLDSLKRFNEETARGGNGAPYYKKRIWDRRTELDMELSGRPATVSCLRCHKPLPPSPLPPAPDPLRVAVVGDPFPPAPLPRTGERGHYESVAKGWLSYIDKLGAGYKTGLWDLLDEDQQSRGYFKSGWNPFTWSRIEQINFAVTYGLTAIGLCLMLGLFTRLAALGGAAFMAFVILSQLSWPTIYPPPGPEAGHALLIDKSFIEMVALLLVATTAVGRWGGLDAFLSRWLPFPLCCCKKRRGGILPSGEIPDN
jgi:uncharacterized membrane protein YphA (DoxX/SURF4 family)